MLQFQLRPHRASRSWTHEVEQMLHGFGEELIAAPCEIVDSAEAYRIYLDVPGFKKEDISIEFRDRHLVITGERKAEPRAEGEQVLRNERRHGKIVRTFSLPEGIAAEKAEAKFTDGILEVRLPRTAVEVRRIPVN